MQRMEPTQSRMANQLVISYRKRIQAGVFSFYGSLLSPYSKFRRAAASLVRPISKFVPKRKQSSSKLILC